MNVLVVLFTGILIVGGFMISLPDASASGSDVDTDASDQTRMAITIYNDGTGLIKDTREIDLPDGEFDLAFMDVAATIDATSVHFVSNTDPDALSVIEQNYEYDLVSTDSLYEKHLDRHISVMTENGEIIEGTLLGYQETYKYNEYNYYDYYDYYDPYYYEDYYSDYYRYDPYQPVNQPDTGSSGGLIIQTESGISVITDPMEIQFEQLPEGLITKPTLRWLLDNETSGTHEVEMSYLASGMGWNANYVAIVNNNDSRMDLSGWVTLNNNSGTSYYDANLKLVAGEVNRVEPDYELKMEGDRYWAAYEVTDDEDTGFVEESFFEYHLYTLQRPATVMNNQQKQISLLEGEGVRVDKIFVFDPGYHYYSIGDTAEGVIEVRLQFMNSERNSLGIPLPKGIFRVFKEDSSGSLQFIGEDSIDHTPKDEEIDIFMGEAFDIVGERAVMDRRKINNRTWEYDVKVTIRNHKDERVEIVYWDHVSGDWEVRRSNLDHIQKDASTVEFTIPVNSDGEMVLEYTIRREW